MPDQLGRELALQLGQLGDLAGLDQLAQPRLDPRADPAQPAHLPVPHEVGDRHAGGADRLGGAAVGAGRVRVRLGELEQRGERVQAVGDVGVVHGQAGRVKRNALPAPADSTQMRPPWASTMRRHTARPIPTPSTSLVGAGEHAEDPGRLVRIDAEAVVAHGHDPLPAVAQRRDLDPQRRRAAVLHGVPEQVLQHAAQLPRVALDLRQLADLERRALEAGRRSSATSATRSPSATRSVLSSPARA